MPSVNRSKVVLVDFPYSDGRQSKIRPALVVQADDYNSALSKTIVAMITEIFRRRADASHVLLDPAQHPGVGVSGPSLVSCINLFTVDQSAIFRVLGRLTPDLEEQVDGALATVLNLPIESATAE